MCILEAPLELIGVFPQIVQERGSAGLLSGAERRGEALRQVRHATEMIAKQFRHARTVGIRAVSEKSTARILFRVAHRFLRNTPTSCVLSNLPRRQDADLTAPEHMSISRKFRMSIIPGRGPEERAVRSGQWTVGSG